MEHVDIKVEEPWSDNDDITVHFDMLQRDDVDIKIKPEPFQYPWSRDVKGELFTQTKDETAAVKTEKGNIFRSSAAESRGFSDEKTIDTNLPTLKSECQATSQVDSESILPTSVLIDLKSEKHLTIPNASSKSNKISWHKLISIHAIDSNLNLNYDRLRSCLKKNYSNIEEVDKSETDICRSHSNSDWKMVETVGACSNHSPCETSDKLNYLEDKTVQFKLTLKSKNKHECNTCGKAFRYSSRLISHIRGHTGERPFKCTMCDKAFSNKGNMLSHTRTHTGSKPFKCTYCDKTFSDKRNMLSHTWTHTGSKPFKCTMCDKAFFNKGNMLRHTKTHTRSKQKCTMCDKTFSNKGNMLSHTRTHTGSKLFKCTYCDKAFSVKSTMLRHTKTHTGSKQKCTMCDKTFSTKTNMLRHTMTHTEPKPFKCTFCDKAFSRKKNMLRHTLTHGQDKK